MSSEAEQPQCQVTRASASVTRAVGPGRRMAVALWRWCGRRPEGYIPTADLHLHGGRHGPCTLSPKPLCLHEAPDVTVPRSPPAVPVLRAGGQGALSGGAWHCFPGFS